MRAKPRPGRPRLEEGSPQVRQRLVEAAIALARERGFQAIGVRQIASAAGVTPGMIAYYFGDKRGLYEAMFEATYQRLVERMRALLERPASGGDPIARLVDLQISTLADTPWLPPLLAREVLARESPLREFFAERLAKGPGVLIPQMLRREMAAGRIRADLDPMLLMISIFGMGMVAYLMQPVAGPALGYELDDDFRDRLIAHVQALLARGLAPAGERDEIALRSIRLSLARSPPAAPKDEAPRFVGTLERDRIELIAEAPEPIVELAVRRARREGRRPRAAPRRRALSRAGRAGAAPARRRGRADPGRRERARDRRARARADREAARERRRLARGAATARARSATPRARSAMPRAPSSRRPRRCSWRRACTPSGSPCARRAPRSSTRCRTSSASARPRARWSRSCSPTAPPTRASTCPSRVRARVVPGARAARARRRRRGRARRAACAPSRRRPRSRPTTR